MDKKLFDIVRKWEGIENVSGQVDTAAVRGLAMARHATDPTKIIPCSGENFIGHLLRDVVDGGATLEQEVFPTGLEFPYTTGEQASCRDARAIEAEGTDLIDDSGTGDIDENTAVGTKISFINGKLYVAQAGDVVYYTLEAQLTPQIAANTFRIRCTRV